MELIQPNTTVNKDWEYGDIIVTGEYAFLVAKDVECDPLLINLKSGTTWYSKRAKNLKGLTDFFKADYPSIKHYSKNEFRLYIEGP